MRQVISPIIRKTCGKVVKYKKEDGYGFAVIGDERWNDVFISHRDIEPEEEGRKFLDVGDFIKFDLHQSSRSYVAKNVYRITEDEYFQILESLGV